MQMQVATRGKGARNRLRAHSMTLLRPALLGAAYLDIKTRTYASPAHTARHPPGKTRHFPQQHPSYDPDAVAEFAIDAGCPWNTIAALIVDLQVPSRGRLCHSERQGGKEKQQKHSA
jgi:hypothetical protein